MSDQTEHKSTWKTVIAEGLVWACVAFSVSWFVFYILCFMDMTSDRDESNILQGLFYPVIVMTDYLRSRDIISRDNWPGGMLVCYATPWMISGFIFGVCRSVLFKPSAMSKQSGCLVTSAIVVLLALLGVVLIFIL